MAGRWVVKVFLALCISCTLFGAGRTKELKHQGSSVSLTQGTSFLSPNRYVPDELLIKFRGPAADRLKRELLAGIKTDQIRLTSSFEQKKNRLKVKRLKGFFLNLSRIVGG